jgi:hypothetical protein
LGQRLESCPQLVDIPYLSRCAQDDARLRHQPPLNKAEEEISGKVHRCGCLIGTEAEHEGQASGNFGLPSQVTPIRTAQAATSWTAFNVGVSIPQLRNKGRSDLTQ